MAASLGQGPPEWNRHRSSTSLGCPLSGKSSERKPRGGRREGAGRCNAIVSRRMVNCRTQPGKCAQCAGLSLRHLFSPTLKHILLAQHSRNSSAVLTLHRCSTKSGSRHIQGDSASTAAGNCLMYNRRLSICVPDPTSSPAGTCSMLYWKASCPEADVPSNTSSV
jgi:hypothetical protein